MRFKFYRLQLTLRLLLLAFTIYFFASTGFEPEYRATYLGLGALALFQIILLIRFHENSIRQINRFLNSVKYDDFTEQFQADGAGNFQKELAWRLNEAWRRVARSWTALGAAGPLAAGRTCLLNLSDRRARFWSARARCWDSGLTAPARRASSSAIMTAAAA